MTNEEFLAGFPLDIWNIAFYRNGVSTCVLPIQLKLKETQEDAYIEFIINGNQLKVSKGKRSLDDKYSTFTSFKFSSIKEIPRKMYNELQEVFSYANVTDYYVPTIIGACLKRKQEILEALEFVVENPTKFSKRIYLEAKSFLSNDLEGLTDLEILNLLYKEARIITKHSLDFFFSNKKPLTLEKYLSSIP